MFAAPAAETAAAAEGGAAATTPTPAADSTAPTDPFSPAAVTADHSVQLDLFSMQPVDDSNSLFSSVEPTSVQASVSTTTSTVAPTAFSAPTIDLFAGFFDPMPDSSVPKTDPNPSLDQFSAAFDGLGDVLMPAMAPQAAGATSPVKPMGGDLDSAMANMAS
ncbi:hypothetical protein cypCar_00022518, partial [Cyprinus carpio]